MGIGFFWFRLVPAGLRGFAGAWYGFVLGFFGLRCHCQGHRDSLMRWGPSFALLPGQAPAARPRRGCRRCPAPGGASAGVRIAFPKDLFICGGPCCHLLVCKLLRLCPVRVLDTLPRSAASRCNTYRLMCNERKRGSAHQRLTHRKIFNAWILLSALMGFRLVKQYK